jgi:hypothetical protein
MAKSDVSDIREIRKYAGEVQRLASALSDDKDFAKRLVDAVHEGSSAEVEKVFAECDVRTDVRITTVDGADAGHGGTTEISRTATPTKTKTITVTIGIGPFSISVSVKKESK